MPVTPICSPLREATPGAGGQLVRETVLNRKGGGEEEEVDALGSEGMSVCVCVCIDELTCISGGSGVVMVAVLSLYCNSSFASNGEHHVTALE